jgi:hypothetical protein
MVFNRRKSWFLIDPGNVFWGKRPWQHGYKRAETPVFQLEIGVFLVKTA